MPKHIIVETREDYENRTKNYREPVSFLEFVFIALIIAGVWMLLAGKVLWGIVFIAGGGFGLYNSLTKARKRIKAQRNKYQE